MAKPKNTKPAQPAAPAAEQKVVALFVMFAMKTGNPVRTQVGTVQDGAKILKEVYFSINEKKPYLNEERGILINPEEISSVYVIAEQVK
jgi:hypothetical protein